MGAQKHRTNWDECAALNCEFIASWGAFDGYSGSIDFDGCKPDAIHFEHDPQTDRCTVFYVWPGKDDDKGPVRSTITMERRPCRFGGSRPYFRCPDCGRATLRLAILPEGLRCGQCGRIQYKSRLQTDTGRLVRKVNKIATRLDMENFYAPMKRPPRMRTETYARLCAELESLQREINRRVAIRSARSKGMFGAYAAFARWGL